MAWVLLVQNLTVPGFAWLRAESKALFFALLSITNLLTVFETFESEGDAVRSFSAAKV